MKKIYENLNPLKSSYAFAVAVAAGLGILAWEINAQAATYNFYFNNTEQGDNSTASPSVTVEDGKMSKKASADAPAVTKSVPEAVPAPVAAPATSPPVAPASQAVMSEYVPASRHSTLHLMAGYTQIYGTGSDYGKGFVLGTSMFFTRDVGIHVYGGFVSDTGYTLSPYGSNDYGNSYGTNTYDYQTSTPFAGAELEVVPIHISAGRIDSLVDLGFLVGASSLYHSDGNWVSPHIGFRANLNLGDHWGLTAAGRGNLSYKMAEAGLALRF